MGTRKFRTKLVGMTAAVVIAAGCSSEKSDPDPGPDPNQERISELNQTAQQAAGKLACMLGDTASGAGAYDHNNFGNKNYILGPDLIAGTPDDGNQTAEMGARRAPGASAILHAGWTSPQDPNTRIRVEVQGTMPVNSGFLDVTRQIDLAAVNSVPEDIQPKHVSIVNGEYNGMLTRDAKGNVLLEDGSSDGKSAPSGAAIEEFARRTTQSLQQLNTIAGTDCN